MKVVQDVLGLEYGARDVVVPHYQHKELHFDKFQRV